MNFRTYFSKGSLQNFQMLRVIRVLFQYKLNKYVHAFNRIMKHIYKITCVVDAFIYFILKDL